jgi:hypothetical protein
MMVGMDEPTPKTEDIGPTPEDLWRRIAACVRAELARMHVRAPAALVGEILGLHRNTITDRLNGHTPFYAWEIWKIAKTLDIPVARLLDVGEVGGDIVLPSPRGAAPRVLGPALDSDQ